MAVLCWLGSLVDESDRPDEVHLFYAHFKEHSDDTNQFVLDGVFWARERFKKVIFTQTDNSVMDFFEEHDFIPHPTNAKCSVSLKIEPMLKYAYANYIDFDLIGYVAKEKQRIRRLNKSGVNDLFFQKTFPISAHDDEWCFEIVRKNIGWYPKIYDIKNEKGKRVFKHNNCLPCKNMTEKDMLEVAKHYPEKMQRAKEVEKATGSFFGRKRCGEGCFTCEFD